MRLVFAILLLPMCTYVSCAHAPVYDTPVAKKLNVHTMTKQSQKAWAKYLAMRG